MVADHVNMDGFKIGETAYNEDCDLPLCFGNQVLNWDNALFNMISLDNAVPFGEAANFINGCGGKGYIFFQYGNRKFHVNLMDFPECVYGSHLKQEGQSFEEYLNIVLFHYAMVAYKIDLKLIFNEDATQNIFISNMDNPDIV